jgi:hypothetical protein
MPNPVSTISALEIVSVIIPLVAIGLAVGIGIGAWIENEHQRDKIQALERELADIRGEVPEAEVVDYYDEDDYWWNGGQRPDVR